MALGRADSHNLELSALHVGCDSRPAAEKERHLTGKQVRNRGTVATVRNMRELHSGQAVEKLSAEMRHGAVARGSEINFSRIRFGLRDDLTHRSEVVLGIAHQHHRVPDT